MFGEFFWLMTLIVSLPGWMLWSDGASRLAAHPVGPGPSWPTASLLLLHHHHRGLQGTAGRGQALPGGLPPHHPPLPAQALQQPGLPPAGHHAAPRGRRPLLLLPGSHQVALQSAGLRQAGAAGRQVRAWSGDDSSQGFMSSHYRVSPSLLKIFLPSELLYTSHYFLCKVCALTSKCFD